MNDDYLEDEANREISDELERGDVAARMLVEHLLCMGASSSVIPVIVADEKFEVTVRRVPVDPVIP